MNQEIDILQISKSQPVEPEINPDGWYCQCIRCFTEVTPTDIVCPTCNQALDWSWFGKQRKIKGDKNMSKVNLKGITAETVTGVFILVIALINAVLQMFGINTLPIEDGEISNIISTIFLIVTTLWNTWKNRNLTTASQISQCITDAIKNGEILENDVKELIDKIKKMNGML